MSQLYIRFTSGIEQEKYLCLIYSRGDSVEVPFMPARVILQDFTGVPAVVDFAAMRDAVQVFRENFGKFAQITVFQALGGDPETINPLCPSDLVIDHSVQVILIVIVELHVSNFNSGRRLRDKDITGSK